MAFQFNGSKEYQNFIPQLYAQTQTHTHTHPQKKPFEFHSEKREFEMILFGFFLFCKSLPSMRLHKFRVIFHSNENSFDWIFIVIVTPHNWSYTKANICTYKSICVCVLIRVRNWLNSNGNAVHIPFASQSMVDSKPKSYQIAQFHQYMVLIVHLYYAYAMYRYVDCFRCCCWRCCQQSKFLNGNIFYLSLLEIPFYENRIADFDIDHLNWVLHSCVLLWRYQRYKTKENMLYYLFVTPFNPYSHLFIIHFTIFIEIFIIRRSKWTRFR